MRSELFLAVVSRQQRSVVSRHAFSAVVGRHAFIALLCLLLAGCGVISIGASNSPDWCPGGRDSKGCP